MATDATTTTIPSKIPRRTINGMLPASAFIPKTLPTQCFEYQNKNGYTTTEIAGFRWSFLPHKNSFLSKTLGITSIFLCL